MRAIVTAVVAAIEACAAAVVGIAAVAIPAVLLWIVTFGIAAEPAVVASIVSGVWLLAHFVPLQFSLTLEAAYAFGLPPEALTIIVSLAPLGITLITAVFAARSGLRLARRGGVGAAGILGGTLGFAGAAAVVGGVAGELMAWPLVGAVAVAALVYAICAGTAFVLASAIRGERWWRLALREVQRWLNRIGVPGVAALPLRVSLMSRLAAASLAAVIGVAAVGFAVALTASFADVITIAQVLQLDAMGSLLLFIVQLAALPIAVVWALAWLTGAGFELGGSFSPFVEAAGPLPALPMLGAVPSDWGSLGALAPTLLILVNVAVGVLMIRRTELRRASWVAALTTALVAAAVVGLVVVALCAIASGSVGPGRLSAAGPNPWLVGGLSAGLAAVGLLAGVAAGKVDYARFGEQLPAPLARWSTARAEGAKSAARDEDLDPASALTVDLSGIRPTGEGDATDRAAAGTAPVVDLFAGTLHEHESAATSEGATVDSEVANETGSEDEMHDLSDLSDLADILRTGEVEVGRGRGEPRGSDKNGGKVIALVYAEAPGAGALEPEAGVDTDTDTDTDFFETDVFDTDVLDTEVLETGVLGTDQNDTAVNSTDVLHPDVACTDAFDIEAFDTDVIEPESLDGAAERDATETGAIAVADEEIVAAFAWDADGPGSMTQSTETGRGVASDEDLPPRGIRAKLASWRSQRK